MSGDPVAVEARLRWQSRHAQHIDRLIVRPAALQARSAWAAAANQLAAGTVTLDAAPWCQPTGQPLASLPASAFRLASAPLPGRCYPRLAFEGLAQGPRDKFPVRLLGLAGARLQVDSNHPLAGVAVSLELVHSQATASGDLRLDDLFQGPGLQAPPDEPDSAYFVAAQLARDDEADDATFYAEPRLVHHLDAACRREVAQLYARFLRPGARVLDLMASWESHLPEVPDLFVAGLGMNAAELDANPRLAERIVKDLNRRSGLPWCEAQFDVVLCSASIEYLTQPQAVLREARRVLRPGGVCVVTFSDRWFPPKAIRVWRDLHPFERQALVLSLFLQAGFSDLHTESLRGLARPPDDPYIAQRLHADPLFAVWGVA